jgi:hypothetical protein
MPANNPVAAWLGQRDETPGSPPSAATWFPTVTKWPLLYAGTQKSISWLGQGDPFLAWIPSSLVYMKDGGSANSTPTYIPLEPNSGLFGYLWTSDIFVIALPFNMIIVVPGTLPGTTQQINI